MDRPRYNNKARGGYALYHDRGTPTLLLRRYIILLTIVLVSESHKITLYSRRRPNILGGYII